MPISVNVEWATIQAPELSKETIQLIRFEIDIPLNRCPKRD